MRGDAADERAQRFGPDWALTTGAAGLVLLAAAALAPLLPTAADPSLHDGLMLARVCAIGLGAALIGAAVLLRRTSRGSAAREPETEGGRLVPLFGILALATLLRAIGLDSGLWYDEVVTLVEFVRLSPGELLTKYTSTNNHVLYSLCAHASVASFGESPWALRLPAAAFGVASIVALWRLGLQLCTRREALLACLLLALSYHHIWFSQNARGYTGLLFFSLLGTSLFLEGMRRGARELWLGYALVLALALYTHLSAVFVFASHGLVYAWMFLRARIAGRADPQHPGASEWWPLLGFALGALLTLQFYAVALPQLLATFGHQQEGSSGTRVDDWTNPLWTALEIVRGLGLGAASWIAASVLSGAAAAGFLNFARRNLLLAALIALPVLLTGVTLLALSFHVWPRYFLVSIGFAALLLVRGGSVIAEALASQFLSRSKSAEDGIAAGLFGAMLLGSLAMLPANYAHPKQDFASARDFIADERQSEDAVVAIGLAIYPIQNYYAPDWLSADSLAALDAIRIRSARTWVISSFPTYLDAIHPDLSQRLERDFELQREFRGTVGDGDVSVYRSRAASLD